ncbi:hypothetical protein D3C72_1525620 [compost metagenome]
MQRLVSRLELLFKLLQLASLFRAQVAPGFQALCLYIQLPTHFFAGTLRLGQDRAQALDLRIALFQQFILRPAGAGSLAMLTQQALVVAVQAGQLVLLDDHALLQLAHFHLQLLQLRLVAALFLFTLFAAGVAVVLQRIAGMTVLVFQ